MAEGESVLAQPGAMLAMTPGFAIDVRAGMHMEGRRGLARGLRSLFGGESFFTVGYRAKRDDQHLMLAPDQMGEIRALEAAMDGLRVMPMRDACRIGDPRVLETTRRRDGES